MKKALSLLAAIVVLAIGTTAMAASMIASKHNMWSYSTNNAATTSGTNKEVCVFCHTPHNAVKNRALWNRSNSAQTFALYTSGANDLENATWYKQSKGVINTASISLMCLSCHDGVSSLGGLVVRKKGTITLQQDTMLSSGTSTLGTDLTNDHPINMNYINVRADMTNKLAADQAAITARKSATGTEAKLINGTDLECASCHDVHNTAFSPFLRDTMEGSALCLQCHLK